MWQWLKSLVSARSESEASPSRDARPVTRVTGRFAPFHKYLDERYADVVVLTFDEIEAISGFALPEGARLDLNWWTATGATDGVAPYLNAWRRANRTARANVAARTITFERRGPDAAIVTPASP